MIVAASRGQCTIVRPTLLRCPSGDDGGTLQESDVTKAGHTRTQLLRVMPLRAIRSTLMTHAP